MKYASAIRVNNNKSNDSRTEILLGSTYAGHTDLLLCMGELRLSAGVTRVIVAICVRVHVGLPRCPPPQLS